MAFLNDGKGKLGYDLALYEMPGAHQDVEGSTEGLLDGKIDINIGMYPRLIASVDQSEPGLHKSEFGRVDKEAFDGKRTDLPGQTFLYQSYIPAVHGTSEISGAIFDDDCRLTSVPSQCSFIAESSYSTIVASAVSSPSLLRKPISEENWVPQPFSSSLSFNGDSGRSENDNRDQRKKYPTPLAHKVDLVSPSKFRLDLMADLSISDEEREKADEEIKTADLQRSICKLLRERCMIKGKRASEASRLCADLFTTFYPDVLRSLDFEEEKYY